MSRKPTSSGSPERAHLPPWLHRVPLPARPRSRSAPSSEIAADDPGWLSDPLGGPEHEKAPAAKVPPASSTSRIPRPSGTTDWLRSMGVEEKHQSSAASPKEPGVSRSDMPSSAEAGNIEDIQGLDWLRDVSPEELSRDLGDAGFDPSAFETPARATPGDMLPDWLTSDMPTSDAEPPAWLTSDEPAPSDSLPTWLKVDEQESTSTADLIPNWMQSSEPPAPPAASAGRPSALPDWLSDAPAAPAAPEPPAAPPAPPPPPAASAGDESVPDWLRGEMSAAAEPAPPPPPAASAGDESVPDWLRGEMSAAAEPPVAAPPPAASAGDESVPDWLRGEMNAAAEPPVAAPPPAASAGDESVPDWLRGEMSAAAEPPPPVAAPPPAASAGDESVPDWLRGEMSAAAEPPPPVAAPPPAASAGDESVPDWLRGEMSAAAEPPVAAPPPAASAGDESVPDWLRGEMDTTPPPAAPPMGAAAEPAAEDIPVWLRGEMDTTPPPAAPPMGAPPEPAAEDIPAWLRGEMDTPPPPAAPPMGATPEPAAEDIPAWLRGEMDTTPPPAAAPPMGATPEPAVEDIPDWLSDDAAAMPASTPEASTGSAPPAADVPPWMAEESQGAAPAVQPASADMPPWLSDVEHPGVASPSMSGDAGLPSWLRDAEAEQPPAPAATRETIEMRSAPPARQTVRLAPEPAPPTEDSSSFFGGADLPSWLRVPEQKAVVDPGEARSVNWLANLPTLEDENEPVAVAMATSAIALPQPSFTRSPQQIAAASLLQHLVAAPYPEIPPAEAPAELSLWQRIGLERVLYTVLALALLLGSLFPSIIGGAGLNTTTPNEANISGLAEQIDQLSEDDIVLLAYEWDAQRISELKPLERAITDHLIDREVGIVSVSTDPQGTLLSFDLRDRLQAAGYEGRGVRYILLGYKPGRELALRGMAQNFQSTLRSDFQGQDMTISGLAKNRLDSLDDFGMIVLMADQTQDVQSWIEQVYRVVPQVPMVVLVPAEVAPVVEPYLDNPGIFYLAGKRDALTYAAVRGGSAAETASAARDDGKLAFAILIFVVLLIIGMAVSAISRRGAER